MFPNDRRGFEHTGVGAYHAVGKPSVHTIFSFDVVDSNWSMVRMIRCCCYESRIDGLMKIERETDTSVEGCKEILECWWMMLMLCLRDGTCRSDNGRACWSFCRIYDRPDVSMQKKHELSLHV